MSKLQLYINPAILSSKEAGGFPVHTFVRAINVDCGLDCQPSCPDGDCLPRTNRSTRARQNASQAQLVAVVQILTARIDQLEARLAQLEPVGDDQAFPVLSLDTSEFNQESGALSIQTSEFNQGYNSHAPQPSEIG